MGGGASILHTAVKENPNLTEHYRNELAAFFAGEYVRMRNLGLSEGDIREELTRRLAMTELQILKNVALLEKQCCSKIPDSEDERFLKDCKHAVNSISSKGGISFLCCVDGSPPSDQAYNLCLALMRRHDYLCVFHAFADNEQEEADTLKARIQRQVLDLDSSPVANLSSSQVALHFEDRYSRTPLRVLQDLLGHCRHRHHDHGGYGHGSVECDHLMSPGYRPPDFVVLGHAGVGAGSDGAFPTSLGSTSELALRSVHVPCIVAKQSCPVQGPRRFAMAVNFSECSRQGLETVRRLIQPRDSLVLLFVVRPHVDPEKAVKIEEYYQEDLQKYGPVDSKFVAIHIDTHHTVESTIIDFVNGPQRPDFIALAPRAKPSREHSAITEYVIINSRASVILCKN
mmetsp:Transcript_3619/g.5618  ORF Transcript_3619/g.5618 Transcript_3619/m.5618 type:complete len:399 (-) Transcript_3619:280-1476(-)|eukprot:CAMPEP_0185026852 /NCGR_PEP_ID=MMETSP1103-20130426/11386_1 /TAXON_ID=36769 /ORGANISM="Paraphysomonas bandaiensis, Strain Caron Lab Isolate" /LENGTH=398 /DNA_ID=CAMNT_0027560581 /DNA_START=117 /DNA_END=1313 /DNA_ORIENTATION=+